MKSDLNPASILAENTKGLLQLVFPHNNYVFLLDKRAHVVWCSEHTPIPENRLLDSIPIEDAGIVEAAVSRCILHNETVEYVTHGRRGGNMPEGPPVLWKVRISPSPDLPVVAAIGICSLLPGNYKDFTQDDRELVRYLADDMSLKEIAAKVSRSESAIDSRIKVLKDKLGVRNLAGLVASAMINGLR